MKIIRNQQKEEDPAKAAIYNPKEFRGMRTAAWDSVAVQESSNSSFRWIPIVFLLSVIAAVGWYWRTGYSQAHIAPLPATGEMQRFYQATPNTIYGPFRLMANTAPTNYFVKLEDWQTGAPVLTVFVRRGEEANVQVPIGVYRAKYAYGDTWHGLHDLFGQRTVVANVTRPLQFSLEPHQVRGKVIDLNPRVTGNLQISQGGKNNF